MAIITFDEWKKECGNDTKKLESFKRDNFDGKNQFTITFEQLLNCKKDNNFIGFVFKGANCFLLRDQNDNETNEFDITEDDFNNFEFFRGKNRPSDGDKGLPYEGVNKKIYKEGAYAVQGFYTILLLFCIKKNVLDDADIQNLSSKSGTNFYIKIKNKDIIHTGLNVDDLFPRAIELIEKLIKKYENYNKYKIVFIPNKNIIKKNSENNNNGGNNKMSVNDNNPNYEINKYIGEKIDAHKQIIFTGAPGTGKTYSVREYVKNATQNDESRYKFVQFHSSYDYTDFVEGIRPAPKGNNSGENMFVRMDGIFKAFCRKIVENNVKILENKYNFSKSDINDLYYAKESNEDAEEIKQKRKNTAIRIKNIIMNNLNDFPQHYFIIDEINRADLSKVFGELMFGLEEDYRGVQNRFPTQYSNLPTYKMNDKTGTAEKEPNDCFKNGFFVPENLTIIGTMNDIDRSVETFDFALRRRFAWVEIKANAVMRFSVAAINGIKEGKIDDDFDKIINRIKEMNNIISEESGKKLGLNESYHIGPAYFKNLFDKTGNDNRTTIFNEKIEPILREYTRGRNSDTVDDFVGKCGNALGINKNE